MPWQVLRHAVGAGRLFALAPVLRRASTPGMVRVMRARIGGSAQPLPRACVPIPTYWRPLLTNRPKYLYMADINLTALKKRDSHSDAPGDAPGAEPMWDLIEP